MAIIIPQRTVDIVLGILRKKILRGEYPPLSLLPSERKLALELSINRQTLRSALARLESEGLVQPFHGRGIQVLDFKERGAIDLLSHEASPGDLEEFFTLRKNLAAEAASLACSKASSYEINQLRDVIADQHKTKDIEDFFLGDLHFTKLLVLASKSTTLRLLFNSFERVLLGQKEVAIKSLENRESAIESYFALVALIQNRNPILCRKVMLFPSSLTEEEQMEIQRALSLEYNPQ